MKDTDLQRIAVLYLPIAAALLLRLVQGPRPRRFASCLLSALWTLPTLLIIQHINQSAHWWTFPNATITLGGMPLELYIGWTVLWGILPQLALPCVNLVAQVAAALVLDLLTMSLLPSVVHLNSHWLAGEVIALVFVLTPALALARWTQDNTHLFLRAGMQIALSGLLFLFMLPEIAFALRPGRGWQSLWALPRWELQLALQFIALLALPGVSAVAEFAQCGRGTPIPYDPPQRLVTTGIYRYLSSPMQLSCALVMLMWSALLRNPWLLLIPAISIIYSIGIASWDEDKDLTLRFGATWSRYRKAVNHWLPHWRPYPNDSAARLYIATTCGPCSQLLSWIETRHPLALEILPAETIPNILRIRYVSGTEDGESTEGVRALARVLEHLHLGWALAGAALRLPLVWQLAQLLADASGFGPRELPYCLPRSHSAQAPTEQETAIDFSAPAGTLPAPRKLQ